MKADHYYGKEAKGYDAKRESKEIWKKEQAGIESFVNDGPVLDIPIGTGRYIDIYESKGLEYTGIDISGDMLDIAKSKYPDANLQHGDVFNIHFPDKSFETVVCTRLMHWFYPSEMMRAVRELCRVGKSLVITIRTGASGKPKGHTTYTHDKTQFLSAMNMLQVGRIRVGDHDNFEMYKFRDVTWDDVHAQFQWHEEENAIQKLAEVWMRRHRLDIVNVLDGKLTVEYWNGSKFKEVLYALQNISMKEKSPHKIITTLKPRDDTDAPPIYFRYKGRYGMLDGRRRANQLAKSPIPHPVIIIELGD